MTEITIAVPTHESLSKEMTVEVDEPTDYVGDEIEGDITAIMEGRVGDVQNTVVAFVRDSQGSISEDAAVFDSLKDAVELAVWRKKREMVQ